MRAERKGGGDGTGGGIVDEKGSKRQIAQNKIGSNHFLQSLCVLVFCSSFYTSVLFVPALFLLELSLINSPEYDCAKLYFYECG